MSDKKVVIWDADTRELPGIGVAKKGERLNVPTHMAKSYVYQGLAVYPTVKKQEKTK